MQRVIFEANNTEVYGKHAERVSESWILEHRWVKRPLVIRLCQLSHLGAKSQVNSSYTYSVVVKLCAD